jgi:hypothetical protein
VTWDLGDDITLYRDFAWAHKTEPERSRKAASRNETRLTVMGMFLVRRRRIWERFQVPSPLCLEEHPIPP